jgi:3'(2'), 5'-bisphosphate nucleotidase
MSIDTDPAHLRTLVPPLLALARGAAAAILEVYATDFAVQRKDDASPLTLADLRAHELIVAGLARLTPPLPVLSEESSDIDSVQRLQWPAHWLVDPLDGTREFLARNGEFTVNIGLIAGHAPVLGVVCVPVSGVAFWGIPGLGAWRVAADGRERQIHVQRPAATPLRIVGSRSHRGDSLDALLGRIGAHELVAIGSSLKFCLLAEGRADFYPRLGPTSEWDTAAADAILRAAGGRVMTLQGEDLRYNTRADLLNPRFLACADPERDWLQLLQSD